MGKRKTHEEFVKEVELLVGDEYTVLGQYTNNKNKILMRHNTVYRDWETDRKSTRLNSSHSGEARMPSSA